MMNRASFVLLPPLLLAPVSDNPKELGLVHWGRDLDVALEASQKSERPVFLLFQEVPG